MFNGGKRMSLNPPRDYPATNHSAVPGSDEVDNMTLCSVKERLKAEQPVSHEMIHQAVTKLFSMDTHDAYHHNPNEGLRVRQPMRNWLKVKKSD